MELAPQDDSDGTAEAVRKLDFGARHPKQRKAVALFRKQINRIIAEYMRRAAAFKQAYESQREFRLDGVQVSQKDAAINLVDVHR